MKKTKPISFFLAIVLAILVFISSGTTVVAASEIKDINLTLPTSLEAGRTPSYYSSQIKSDSNLSLVEISWLPLSAVNIMSPDEEFLADEDYILVVTFKAPSGSYFACHKNTDISNGITYNYAESDVNVKTNAKEVTFMTKSSANGSSDWKDTDTAENFTYLSGYVSLHSTAVAVPINNDTERPDPVTSTPNANQTQTSATRPAQSSSPKTGDTRLFMFALVLAMALFTSIGGTLLTKKN